VDLDLLDYNIFLKRGFGRGFGVQDSNLMGVLMNWEEGRRGTWYALKGSKSRKSRYLFRLFV